MALFDIVKKIVGFSPGGFVADLIKKKKGKKPSLKFKVGEGLPEKKTTLAPGPTRELAALPKKEPVKFVTPTKDGERIAPQLSIRATVLDKSKVPAKRSLFDITSENIRLLSQDKDIGMQNIKEQNERVKEFTLEIAKEVVRAPVRALVSSTLDVAGSSIDLALGKPGSDAVFTPKTKFEKAIFGEEPIRGMLSQTAKAQRGIQKALGESDISIGASLALAPLAITGLLAVDIIPIGGAEKQLAKQSIKIAGMRNADDIAMVLKTMVKGDDGAIKQIAQRLTKVSDAKQVENMLSSLIKSAIKSTETPTSVKKKIVSQRFRGDKLNLPEAQLKDIESRLGALGLEQRTVRTFAEMEEAAMDLGIDPGKLLKEVEKNRITDKEVIGLRNIINNNSKFIVDSQKRLDTEIINAVDRQALVLKIDGAQAQIDTALKKLVKGGTEAGRTVAAFRIMAKETMDPSFWLTKATKQLRGRELTPEIRNAILGAIKQNDRQSLAMIVANLSKSSNIDKIITLWKAGLLTSPTTHLANIGGNLTMQGLLTASNVVAAPLDVLASLVRKGIGQEGGRTILFSPRTIVAKARGLKKGTKEAGKFLKTGIYSQDMLKKWDIPTKINFDNKIFQGYTDAIFRTLGAEDIVFRKIAIEESMQQQAMLVAKNEGLRGRRALNRTRELLLEPTNEMVVNAIDAAEYATFQSKNALANFLSTSKTKSSALKMGVEIVAPFKTTPTNIAARIADFSPLGFVKAMARAAKPTTRSQKNFIDDISRAITGTGVIAFGAYLAKKGLMTGNIPTNPTERAQFYAESKQPNSVFLFGKWRQMNRLSPAGNLMSLGAEFQEIGKEKEGTELVSSTGFAALKGFTEQTFLQGVSRGLKAINEPERFGSSFVEQTVAGVVPSVIGKTARTIDPKLRVSDNVLQAIQAKIPLLSGKLPPRVDSLGQVVRVPGGRLNLIDPFASTTPKDSPVLKEARRIDNPIGVPSDTVNKIKLTPREFSVYQQIQGQLLEIRLKELIGNENYKKLNDVQKKEEFEKEIRIHRTEMREQVFPGFMIIRYRLPKDINRAKLLDVMSAVGGSQKFNKLSEDKQRNLILLLLNN